MRHLRCLLGACAILAFLLPARASAQFMTQEWVLTAGGGLSDPTGLFEEQMQSGIHGVVSLGYHFNPSWFLGLRAGYFPFESEIDWESSSSQTGIDFWNVDVESRLMLYPESWFTPYLVVAAGVSLEQQTYADSTGSWTVDMVRPGATGGVGLSYHREGKLVSLYTELVYHHFPSENGSRQFLRWTSGLRFSVGGRPF